MSENVYKYIRAGIYLLILAATVCCLIGIAYAVLSFIISIVR